MKNAIMAAIAATIIAGCNTIPETTTMYSTANAIGRAAGYASELASIKQETKDAILQVLDIASKSVPGENETFKTKWTPIIDEEVAKLVEKQKLSDTQAVVVKMALTVACDGIDLIFVRYPKAKTYKDLVAAAVDGFVAGYRDVVNPKLQTRFCVTKEGTLKLNCDIEAYNYLMELKQSNK